MKYIKLFEQFVDEDNSSEKYSVVLLGGSIGDKRIRSIKQLKGESVIDTDSLYDSLNDAKAKAKRMNKILSPGDKKYYGLKYTIAKVVDGKYTGK